MDLVSFLTLATTFATFLTVLEMYNQRRTAYKPDLIVNNATFSIFTFYDLIIGNRKRRNYISLRFLNSNEKDLIKSLKIEIVNLGVGIAKNVKVKCFYDHKEAVELIKNLDNSRSFEVGITSLKIGNEITYSAGINRKDLNFYYSSGVEEITEIPYINTIEKTPQPIFIEIPTSHLALYLIYMQLRSETERETKVPKFPRIIIEATYEDLGGGIYKKRFELHFLISNIGANRKFFATKEPKELDNESIKNVSFEDDHRLYEMETSLKLLDTKKFVKFRIW